jgi:RNA polymerase sigma-70 factor (ECF subfamily)
MAFAIRQESTETPEERDATRLLAAQRDPKNFAPIYEEYFLPVYGYCLRSLRDPQRAADATSETFLKALRGLPGYRARSFRAWLFTIARNVVIATVRRDKLATDEELTGGLVDREPTPEERVLGQESDLRVQELLGRLNAHQAQILELRIAGLTTREIADVLDCSAGAVRVAQFRALTRLRQWISGSAADREEGDNRAL